MTSKKHSILSIFLVFVIILQVSGASRQDGIADFVKETRLSASGYGNNINDQVNIRSTTQALQLANLLGINIKNQLDILLFYQESQNTDGGFSKTINGESDWDTTIAAVAGLKFLDLNNSQLSDWGIFNYVNDTANSLLYEDVLVGNMTTKAVKSLNPELMKTWVDYIITAIQIGSLPTIPIVPLLSDTLAMQFENGTYISFETAITSIQFLGVLGEEPLDSELASKFIRAFEQENHLFSKNNDQDISLKDTFDAINALRSLGRINELEFTREIILAILDFQDSNSGFKDVGIDQISMTATWYAVQILTMLNALDELLAPDVLQTHGFIAINTNIVFLGLFVVALIGNKSRRSKHV